MIIKHLPSGLFPHFDSGFQRSPYEPMVNQSIQIDCRIDEGMPEATVALDWSVDGEKKESIVGQRIYREGDKRIFYRFILEPFADCHSISYAIVGKLGGATVRTKDYHFDVLRQVNFAKVDAIYQENDNFFVKFLGDPIAPVLKISIGEKLRFQLFTDFELPFEPLKEDFSAKIKNYQLKISSNSFDLSISNGDEVLFRINPEILDLKLYLDGRDKVHRLSYGSYFAGSAFYGFGEKFDKVNQKGKSPLNYVVEQYAHQEDKTYLPIPFFYTEKGIGTLNNSTYRSQFFVGQDNKVVTNARCNRVGQLSDDYIFVGFAEEQIKEYQAITGRAKLPPKWCFGGWMSSNGWNTQSEANEQIDQMDNLGIPATVMVLEAWSDEENFYIFNDAKYKIKGGGEKFDYSDFSFDENSKWSSPKAFCERLAENNLKLILWQIPVVKYDYRNNGKQLDNDEQYAIDNNLLITCDDGAPYRITENWFHHSVMPDFYNAKTCRWWFDKRNYLVKDLKVAGFKTDGGEFIFDETAHFCNGKSVEELHNDYPNRYVGAYHDFLDETLGENEGITFSRAGFSGAQKYPIHWAGDQVSEYSELKGQITAGLSLGLSGVPFWGFDIGGFAGDFPTTELYLRSAAFATFAPVMQFHSEPRYGQYYMTERAHFNNDRSPWNMAEVNKDDSIVSVYRKFANLRMNLVPYLYHSAKRCCELSQPLMQHLIFAFPHDERVVNIEDEYMLGASLLVAPLYEQGQEAREVYFPDGKWYGLFDGKEYLHGESQITCSMDNALVFIREGQTLPLSVNDNYVIASSGLDGKMSNRVDNYDNMLLLGYNCQNYSFNDDVNKIFYNRVGAKSRIEYKGELKNLLIYDQLLPEEVMVNGVQASKTYSEVLFNGRTLKVLKIILI